MSAAPAPAVILCGPFASPDSVGGIARWDQVVHESFLQERYGIHGLACSPAGTGSMLTRFVRDVANTRDCLSQVDAPIFQLTAQYMLGTYREYAQFRLARGAGRAVIYDIRGGCFIEGYRARGALLRRRLLHEMLTSAAAVTAEGQKDVDWLRSELGIEATWIANLVHTRDAASYPRARLTQPTKGAPIRVAYSGRLIPDKGIDALIDAIATLRDADTPAHLSLMGGGEPAYETQLRRRVGEQSLEPHVTFCGVLDHHALLEELARQHVYAFPSRWYGEGHPNSVNEAMQVGLPIISSTVGFLPEVVTPECGLLLEDPTADAIAHAIRDFANDWPRLERSGEAAHRRVYAEFSDEVALPRYVPIYDALLEHASS